MAAWSGLVYQAGTLTGNGNSGWLKLPLLAVENAIVRLVPADLATDETLDLDLNVAWDSSGSGDVKIHDFTQVDSNNTAENVILPGEDSVGILWKELGTNAGILGAPMPPYWKLTWTLGGSTKSMTFALYATLLG